MDLGRLQFKYFDAGGHPLRMLVEGRGSPAVIFETGARGSGGAPLEMWAKVQSQVSQFTTTLSYDRAGVGLSAPGPQPRDARQIALELHTALKSAGLHPPYILVGHSFGGPFIRVFAGLYPADVCGLLLVDPTQEEFIKWDDAHHGHKDISDDDWHLIQAGLAEAHDSPIPPGIPIALITATGPKVLPDFMSEKEQREYRETVKMWRKFHQDWVDKVPGAQHVVTEKSGHGVPFFEPELVTESIHKIFDKARASSPPATRETTAIPKHP
jgi:pimeloyl-ACP methyl ester carboxylesterase